MKTRLYCSLVGILFTFSIVAVCQKIEIDNDALSMFEIPDFRLTVMPKKFLDELIEREKVVVLPSGLLKPQFELSVSDAQEMLGELITRGASPRLRPGRHQVRVIQRDCIVQGFGSDHGINSTALALLERVVLGPGDVISVGARGF